MRMVFRDATKDASIWRYVVEYNEYELPPRMDGQVVLDIGAHIGSFAHAVLERNAAKVVCYEPEGDNFRAAVNSGLDADMRGSAVWRSDGDGRLTLLHTSKTPADGNTGGINVFAQWGQICVAVPLDRILVELGHVDLLKIDTEGSEYPIFLTSKELQRAERIVGEWHTVDPIPPIAQVGDHKRYDVKVLRECLHGAGFTSFRYTTGGCGTAGLFWADR